MRNWFRFDSLGSFLRLKAIGFPGAPAVFAVSAVAVSVAFTLWLCALYVQGGFYHQRESFVVFH